MSLNFLDFEQPIAELEAKIDSLTAVSRQDEKLDINLDEEVQRLREKSVELTRKILPILGLGRLPNWHATRAVLIPWIISNTSLPTSKSWRAIALTPMTKRSSAVLRARMVAR